ncbi:MAG: hypothetical protein FWG27_08115 [Treponema sp.]|nr:hypothetical protein [Treponema sp.]
MKNFLRKKIKVLILAIIALLPSCSARINAQMVQDGSGSIQLQAGLEPNMLTLIRSFSQLGGGQAGPLLDAAALNRSLEAAPGIASSALRNSAQEKIAGTIGISHMGDLLNAGVNRFVQYEAPAGAVPGRLAIHLDRSIAPRILIQISSEAVDYLSALMAPAATGEVLTRGEYLLLIESVYGKPLAAEIAASRVTAAITMPGTVKSVKGGTFSGREVRFDISLLDLLVLEQPLDYEIIY